MKKDNTPRKALLYLSLKYEGKWDKIYKAISSKERIPFEELGNIEDKIKCKYVTIFDPKYPCALKAMQYPPFVLFYYGDISILKDFHKCVAVVGSRNASDYGINATLDLTRELAEDFVIVSGLAKGIDSFAHKAAIEMEGKTVGVLGSGIEVVYPSENAELYAKMKENHLIISEWPNYTQPIPEHFPWRNRIIAALSIATVVTQANKEKSGTQITVNWALSFNRAVCAVPYPLEEKSFCNKLIAEGAKLVRNKQDVIDEINALRFDEVEL
jgi:DNA processing protein